MTQLDKIIDSGLDYLKSDFGEKKVEDTIEKTAKFKIENRIGNHDDT